jgi:hypothetical protein
MLPLVQVADHPSASLHVFVNVGQWDSMEEYTCMIPRDTHDGAFYRAVLALHQDLFSLAQQVKTYMYPDIPAKKKLWYMSCQCLSSWAWVNRLLYFSS